MTLAKLDKEEAVRCREGDELAWTLCLPSPMPVTRAGCVAWKEVPGRSEQFTECRRRPLQQGKLQGEKAVEGKGD